MRYVSLDEDREALVPVLQLSLIFLLFLFLTIKYIDLTEVIGVSLGECIESL